MRFFSGMWMFSRLYNAHMITSGMGEELSHNYAHWWSEVKWSRVHKYHIFWAVGSDSATMGNSLTETLVCITCQLHNNLSKSLIKEAPIGGQRISFPNYENVYAGANLI